eukprot:scaffold5249_cov86-Cylindrotheca_fusiformis.AAC.1
MKRFYPDGTPGTPWTKAEDAQWKAQVKVQRTYQEEVVDKIQKLSEDDYTIEQYGALSHNPERYPLFAVKTKGDCDKNGKPFVLITGG